MGVTGSSAKKDLSVHITTDQDNTAQQEIYSSVYHSELSPIFSSL